MELVADRVGFAPSPTAPPLLHTVSATVRSGQLTAFIGPNGAGKSTLLKLLAGLWSPTHGTVTLNGTPLTVLSPTVRAQQLAYLPQHGHCAWSLTVEELVALGRLPHAGASAATHRAAVTAALAATETGHLAHRSVHHLSGGERQRVLLARALAGDPQLLLADEPTQHLDPACALFLMELLRKRATAGTAVAVVLHDLTLAARCDAIYLLHRGAVLAAGDAATVLTDEWLASSYGIRVARSAQGGIVPVTRIASPS